MGTSTLAGPLRDDAIFSAIAEQIVELESSGTEVRAMVSGVDGVHDHHAWCLTDEQLHVVEGDLRLTGMSWRINNCPLSDLASVYSMRASKLGARGHDLLVAGSRFAYLPQAHPSGSASEFVRQFEALQESRIGAGEKDLLAALVLDSVDGVHGLPGVESGSTCALAFFTDRLEFRTLSFVDQPPLATVPLATVLSLVVGGPGEIRRGGGFLGGGFGLEGAALGIAAAGLLNRATTKTEVVTVVELIGDGYQLVGVLRIVHAGRSRCRLLPAYTAIRRARTPSQATASQSRSTNTDAAAITDALRELKRLHEEGLVTSAEYEEKRAELLGRL